MNREYPVKGWENLQVLLYEEQILKRIRELGRQITSEYENKDLVVVGVLKGSFIFMADLVRCIHKDVEIDFIGASSYGSSDTTSGNVKITKDLSITLEGKHLLIVEDIVDTGVTLKYLLDSYLPSKGNFLSVKVCTLLNKPSRRKVDVDVDYCGFTIENKFVVGYGLDYAEFGRNISEIRYICEVSNM